jgi:hypothetical protein
MSEIEIINVLGLSEDDVITYEKNSLLKEEYELFGISKEVQFWFQRTLDDERFLTSIIIIYDEEDLDTVQNGITNKLGEGEYSYYFGESFLDKNLGGIEWKDELIKNNPENLKVITDIINTYPSMPRSRYSEIWPELPLVSYQLDLNQSNRTYGQLTISGFGAVMVDNPDIFKIME